MFAEYGYWYSIKDGDPRGLALYLRHYSAYQYADKRPRKLFFGPGEKMVLMTTGGDALFVWRKFKSGDGQQGVNCAVFRNEGPILSSVLLKEAMQEAARKWPGERLYTYINPRKIRSTNPGYCFKVCGWKQCGITKVHKLLILEYLWKTNE